MAFLIAPSLLASDFSRLGDEIRSVEKAGADWIHVDVMDGHFVPNLTIGAPVIKSLRPSTTLPFDVHLMIKKPSQFLEDFAKAGADHLTVHLEAVSKPLEVIKKIKDLGMKAGLSVKPETPIKEVFPFLDILDLVLVMTVEPGKGGQEFLKDQAKKVKELKAKAKKKNFLIVVDGGIDPKTAAKVKEADVLVAGSYIYQSEDYAQSISRLKKA